ncbi:uncharacterized protein LOC118196114 isoform X2 [Stegodyphus dumicola]|uniref:uncharacterized protein LOC118196114 isoform X2 n=1 Tax=Stegodyphus dumicola TaxID=202533 RepID=UPI0015AA554D|nr:uncharacterized protein LOC118196114 isoform X2 [Stegodyphus dumicola]
MKTGIKDVRDGRGTANTEKQKLCIPPLPYRDVHEDKHKTAFSPIEIKPAFLLRDCYDKGLNNPAYYDPSEARKIGRMECQRKKFSSTGLPDESSGAKLTKVPGLNIWRLEFKKSCPNVSKKSSASWYRLATTLAMIAILALLVGGIAVIVHAVKGGLIFGIPWFPFDHESNLPGISRVAAHFRIMNRHFVSELSDPTSSHHLQLVAELRHSLDVIFMDSSLVNYYNATEDFEFTNGSVVVHCVVILKRPLSDGPQRVGFTFVRALEEGKGILPPGMLYVDVHTVRFTALKKEIEDSSLEDLDENGEWSEWGSWSSCSTYQQLCDPQQIQRRKRNCLGHGSTTLPSAVCIRKTGESTTQIRHCICKHNDDRFSI